MMAPGYLWGSPGMTPPGSGMGMGYGGCPYMMHGPSPYQAHHGRQHGQHMRQGMMGYGHMAPPGGAMRQGPMQQGMMGHGMMDPGSGLMPGGAFRMGAPLALPTAFQDLGPTGRALLPSWEADGARYGALGLHLGTTEDARDVVEGFALIERGPLDAALRARLGA